MAIIPSRTILATSTRSTSWPDGPLAARSALRQTELDRAEHRLHRAGFGQHVDNAAMAPERRLDDGLVERHRHDDAPERDAVVVGRGRREPLGAVLVGRRRPQPVDRERGGLVDPDDRLALVVVAGLRLETPGRRAAFVRRETGRAALGDVGDRGVTGREAEQHAR